MKHAGNSLLIVLGCAVTQPSVARYVQSDPAGLAADANTYTYANNDPLRYVDPNGLCPCGESLDVLQLARSDRRDWSKAADRSDVNRAFGPGTYKCNLFADEQFETAGYHLPNIGGSVLARALEMYPPGAQSLSISGYTVPGWPVVAGPAQPGDLLAWQGHVGIASTDSRSISASPHGVIENDWGFRSGQTPVIRRCTCPR